MASIFGAMPAQPAKRRVFFSFHYQNDIWKVNQVRNSWRYNHENTRESEGFFDGSIWESSRRTGPESLKSLIREGIKNTSVTCVLVGAATYERRWVRYELARSVVKGNGLLAVKINLMGNQQGYVSQEGPNPLDYMGVYNAGGAIRLAERKNGNWVKYDDYTQAVDLPATWVKPHDTTVIRLSRYAGLYCYKTQGGGANFSSWVRQAAADVGR
ncbi:MAG: TIR domain-containing protein [Pseudomonadota bacterium]